MKFPPHLPPRSVSIVQHKQWQRLKLIGVVIVFSLVAGISGASMFVGWFWPTLGQGDLWIATQSPASINRGQVAQRAQGAMTDKIFTVYQKATVANEVYNFSPADKVADAVVVTSQGWLVAYAPKFDSHFKDWRIVSANGSLYLADQVVPDKRSGLVFVKISRLNGRMGEQFKVATFNDATEHLNTIFVYQDSLWYPSFFSGLTAVNSEAHLDTAPQPTYVINGSFKPGAIVINDDGDLVGFVGDSSVLPSGAINHVLASVQSQGRVVYSSLGVEGWYSTERPIIVNEERLVGFSVSRVAATKSSLHKGDIILEINGRLMTPENVWYTIGEKTVRLKVLRNGKTLEVETAVVEI